MKSDNIQNENIEKKSPYFQFIKKYLGWICAAILFIGGLISQSEIIIDFFAGPVIKVWYRNFPEKFDSDTTFNILILPFDRTLEQKEKIKLEENLKKRFDELRSEKKYNIDIIFDEYYDIEDFKIDKNNWKNRGADLILYGDYFNETSDVNREIRINWSLLDNFPYSFDYDSKSEIKPIPKIAEIYNGTLLNDIDYIIYWCIGFLEYQKHNYFKSLILFKEIYNNKSFKMIVPQDTLLNFCIGSCYSQLDSFKLSIEFYDKVLNVNSNNYSSNLNKAFSLNELNFKDEALQYYNKCIDINPQFAIGWNNKGMIFMESGQLDSALTYFEKSIILHPNHPEYYDNKGIALSLLEHYSEAIICFDKAIKLDSNFHYAWFNKGKALCSLGKYSESTEYFIRAHELNPNNSDILINLGIAWAELEIYNLAIHNFERAIQINSNNFQAYNNIALVYMKLEEYNESLYLFDFILGINPYDSEVWHNKGVAYKLLGHLEESLECFEKSIQCDPTNFISWYSKALYYSSKNNKKKMLQSLKRTFSLNSNLRERAKYEPSFKDYFQDKDFINLVY